MSDYLGSAFWFWRIPRTHVNYLNMPDLIYRKWDVEMKPERTTAGNGREIFAKPVLLSHNRYLVDLIRWFAMQVVWGHKKSQ
ncbi:hypothetical protein [Labrys miyagiensis]|uniref:hypothetical protein n=1 Tax=Labrys miyagiensis TaxID=346912 RepID=UPI0024E17683|nr:hypothetical protein [Labrys miyagiensis]